MTDGLGSTIVALDGEGRVAGVYRSQEVLGAPGRVLDPLAAGEPLPSP